MRLRAAFKAAVYLSLVSAVSLHSAQAALPSTPTVVQGSGSHSGGLFSAGADGAEWVLPSGARLRMGAHAIARVFTRPQPLDLGTGGKTPTWSLKLSKGRVDVEVPANSKSAVLVSAAEVSAVIAAGSGCVLIAPGEVIVANADGAVRTFIDNRWTTVARGHMSHIDAARPRGGDSALLPAPVVASGRTLWTSIEPNVTLGGLGWQPVAGATSYDIELRQGAKVITRTSVQEPRVEALAAAGPGEYQALVRSVDRRGIAGAWSRAQPLRVLGVDLPPGAYVENGGVFLNGGQKVTFSHTAGVQMTYVGAGSYVPATEAVGLYRNERTIVVFRLPNSTEDTIVRLEPRDIYAQVVAGPKTALWPKDSLELTIQLLTRAGNPAPAFIEVVPKVLVGVEPIEVNWHRQGNELRATVPPQPSRGPWVVRVDVADQFGNPLGRDFVEVAESAPAKLSRK